MRPFFRPSHRGVLVSTASAACIFSSYRSIFVRESWTPVTLRSPSASEAPFPARLLWQFRSSTPRHLTLCARAPAPQPASLTQGSSFEDLDVAGDPSAVAKGSRGGEAAPVLRKPEDYIYGRLFLRPYNVAQLLTVLQGWSEAPAVIERPRSKLQLSLVSPSTKRGAVSLSSSISTSFSKPRAVQLTAHLTRKLILPRKENGRAAAAAASATPSTDFDPEASEDYPDSVYAEGQMGVFTAVLRDEELVLLTAHLESVLSDFFAMEHHAARDATRRAGESQGRLGVTRGPHMQGGRTENSAPARRHSGTHNSRPQYRSHMYRSKQQTTAAPAHHAETASARNTTTAEDASAALSDLFEEVGNASDNVAPKADTSTPQTSEPTAAAVATQQTEDEEVADDEYEEVVEEVEGDDEEEQQTPDTAAASDSKQSQAKGAADSASAAPSSAAGAGADASLDAEFDPSPRAQSSTAYRTLHTADRGYMAVESDSRYAAARFVRDGSVAAAEVQEVSRVGDFDVMHRTQQAQGLIDKDGTRTTVQATNLTGAFRSTAGEVKGTFAYQCVSTATETSSATRAATPFQEAGTLGTSAQAVTDDADEGGDAEPTMEAKAACVREAVDSEVDEAGEAEAEAEEAAVEKPKRTRGSKKSGGTKKAGKKKSKKTSKRKSALKAPAAEPAADTLAF
ncbi:hypothetical protein ABL78_3222 [Leptomonas seymouri]|uniref:Uncharacterized protein n=1 Tax=Leptomonas seymouri TaxID=5684 RepID=A0A0N1ILF9_LEPSE|nr:hypothetical protein ABL78_3222 [Leptomonas seymouri]|eukprot:KPI87684.1 hypothetical protein ABL78_3222 [Leptomonas seymouri]